MHTMHTVGQGPEGLIRPALLSPESEGSVAEPLRLVPRSRGFFVL